MQATLEQSSTHNNECIDKQVRELAEACERKHDLKGHCQVLKDCLVETSAESARKQGGWLEALAHRDDDVKWNSVINGLSETTYSFLIRSLVDALPTNQNLVLWKKILSASCGSCGSGNQTLLHVLNNCDRKLHLYKWRHDNVLYKLKNFISSKLNDCDILCDLCTENNAFLDRNVHTIPADIFQTSLRPDIVILNRAIKSLTIIEVTIPFESNICQAHERKAEKYSGLIAGLEEKGFACRFHSFVIGARGIAAQGSCRSIRSICKSSRMETKLFIRDLCHIVVKCSYLIFRERDNNGAMFTSIML